MAESIGVVVSVQGVVFAVQADGTERQIFAGDQVMAGEVIRTGPDARAEISIDGQGASFVLEGGQSWLATADTHQTPDDMDSSEAAADVDAIQAAILAGVDPTTVGEATAAGAPGAGTGGQGNEGSSFVTLTRTGEEVDPNAGYQTSTFGADPQQSSEDPGVEPLLTTAVSLTASSVTEDEPGIVVTVSLTTPGESDVTVTTNLGSVLIPAGTTTGVLFVETQDSDPYLDPDSIAVTVTGVSGGEFDEVDLSAAQATADIADTIDGTVLNLTAPDEVDEGTDLTYTATLSNAPQTDVQVTLSNGAAITILAGETSGSVTVPVQGDDVYTDGESLSVTVTGASGGNFEQLDVGSGASGSPVQTAVVDTLDDVTVDLSATDVSEDDPSVTFTATLSAPAGDEAVVVETSLGNITIAAGETSGTLVVDSSDPDVYLDPDTLEATINSVSGGSFESLVIGNGTAVADISDTIDTTTLNLSATEEVAEGGNITYSAVVDNPPQSDLTVELSNGSTITILAGATGGSVSVPAQSDDVYVDGETLSVTVVGTTGGNYEYLEVGSGSSENPVQTAVVDTIDDVTVDLTVADVTEDEAGVTFTATLSAPAGDQPVTIETNLGNITIGAGQSSGTLFVDTSDPDVYIDPDTISATITSASGGNFENLIIGNGSATADISDTIDTTTLNLSAPDSVAEGGTITYTATVSNPTQTELTVTLSNGETITIPAGGSSGSVSISAPADDIYDTGDVISVSVTQAEGGNYENLVIGEGSVTNPVETDVVDTPDDVTVNLTAGDVTEDEAGVTFTATLSAPAGTEPVTVETTLGTITIASGQSSGVLFVDTNDPDVYIDPDTVSATITSASGGSFENLIIGNGTAVANISDTIDTTTLNLSATNEVAEGGNITYSAVVDNPPQGNLTVELSNGAVITILSGNTGGSVSVPAPSDDVYVDGETLSVSVVNTTGGNYENLEVGTGSPESPVQTTVVDTIDAVTVDLSASNVTEDDAGVTFTATLSAPAGDQPVVVETSLGDITIAAGQSSGTLFVDTSDPDVYIDPDSISATITGASGGDFENLVIGNGTATANITDTIDVTTLTLAATPQVSEGGTITYTATVDNAPQGNLSVTLSNGVVITIASGATVGSASIAAPSDDVYNNSTTLTVTVDSAVGGNYEQLSVLNSVQTVVTDTPDQVLVNLSTASVTEDDTGVTFTATLTAPAGDAPVVVETTQGTITIAAGQSTGTLFVDTNDPDVYIDPDVVSATINSVSGGGFESLAVGVGSATANISDTIDPTTLSLSAPESVSEGGEITYTATVTNAPQSPLSINLSNGAQITIGVGQTSGSVTVAAPSDDVYVDEGSLSVNITSTLGGNYENLIIGNGEVSVLVEDTTDTVYAELSGESWVMEADGAELPHTITFVDENGAPAPLKSGETVTFTLAYQSTGEQPGEQLPPEDVEGQQPGIPLPPLPFLGMGDVEDEDFQVKYVEVTVTGNGGNTYEFANLVADDALAEFVEGYIVTLAGIKSDNSTFEDLQISPDNNGAVGVIEDEILHEEQPDLAYSFKLFAIVDGEYVDSATIAEDGGQGEYIVLAVDGNGVPLDSQDQPGGSITVYVGDPNDTADRGDDYVAGETITADVNDSFTIDAKDDALAEGSEQFTLTLGQNWTEASTYEDVDYDTSAVTTNIVDEDPNDPDNPQDPDVAYSFKLFAIVDGEYVDSATIAEDGGQGEYIVLAVDGNGVPLDSQDQPGGSITVYVGDPNDTADRGDDYVAGATITADVNDSFTIDAKDDALAEGSEQFTLTLGQNWTEASTYEDVDYDTSAVITNIVDENPEDEDNPQDPDVAYSFKLFAIVDGEYVDSATIAEDGGQGEYIVLAVDGNGVPLDSQDQPGGSISVYVGDPNDTADRGDDYVAGATITADVNDSFTIDAKDDALAEGSEQFTLTLGQNWTEASTYEDVDYDTSAVITNIVDENPEDEDNPQDPDVAYSFKLFAIVDGEYVDSATIAEDGGQGEYIVLAVDGNGVPLDSQDQPGGSITVYVGDQNDTADRGDDYVAGATITADVNDSFTIDAKDDDLAEGDEQFTLTLGQDWTEASTYEDVDYDTSVVSTTIVDDDNGTITVSAEIQVGENLITNGSFEQFPGSIADGGQKAFQSVDGWTIYSGDEMQIHSGSHNMSGGPNAVPLGAADGDYYMDMESSPNAIGIEQTISGLDAGNLYNLSFSVADKALADPGYYANNPQLGEYQGTTSTILEVYWNGGLVKTIHTGTTEWLEFSFDLEAQGGDNTLRFVEIGVDGDNHGSALDDIKLVDKAALLDIQGTVDNVSDGETVTLTITDGTNSQDVTTTVSGGQYTYNDFDITGWDETAIHVDAETTDTGGNKVTADTSVSKDITATVSDDSGSVTEDATATATGNVLDNDSDADTVLTVTGAGTYEGAYGTLILQANGDYTYTLNNGADKVQALDDNETVVDTFTYTAQDDVGNDHSANLVITINGADEPNVAPTSTNDSVSTPEGVNLTLSLNDFGVYADADNDALAAVKITALPVNGTLLLNSVAVQAGDAIAATQVSQGNLVFVPADSDTDADSAFQFQVQDAAGLWSGTYTTDVNIDAVADQPNVAITLGEPQGETPEVTDLPTAISHVKYMLSDGTTLKFEPYDANITDPTDPTQYIEAIETATGETVTAYYIKSANNVYDAWGNYVGGAINGDASNPLANQSDNTSDPDDYGSGSTYVFGGTSATYDYPVTVTASLNDTDGSESLTLWVTGVPEGATLQGASYNSEENRWELTTETDPEAETEVQLVLEGVPAGSGGFTLTATAVATETNPNGAVDTPTATNTATDRSEVPDVNDPPEFGQTSYSESYQENSATSVVLETVSATDPEGGAVSYAITANVQDGAGNDLFAIDSSGNITLTADGAVAFTNDYEASGNTHVLTVTAFDSQGNTADVQVTLTETNIADQLKQGDNTDNTLSTVGGDNDVLIGDAGGNQTNFDQGTNYNISLIVDTSGSMESRMALTEAALKNLADTLVNHSGSVNLQIVEFGSDLKSNVTFNDIDTSDLSAIESAIEALDDGSYTNYEAGFRAAEDWFSNQSNGYENMAFFLTDGEPNRYLDNSGNVRSGSDSSPEVMQESVEAFADLTALGVTVHGIGIGTGVSTGTLRYFDNTEVAGQETIVVVDEVLANFSGSGDPLDTSSDWTFSGTGGFSSYVEIGGGIFSPDDLSLVDGSKNGDPVVATSNSFSVAAGQVLRFDYDVEYLEGGDLASWSLERNDNGAWSSVAGSSALSGSGEVASQALAAGNYRLVFSVDNSSGDGGLLGGDDRLHIDNIELLSHVDAPYGQPQTVTDGDQLTAVLQGGNTVVTPHDVGDDILIGGDGDDIIFGDAVEHADFAGQGTEGLFNAIEQDEGLSNPSAAQVHQYLVDNEADLIFPASQGGDDELTGGRGNDLLIGGEGQDRFVWKAGDQGTEDHPAEDHVADFELGTDKLDLSDLFDIAAGKSIDDYLFAATEGGDTKLYVNTKGDFNGSQDKNLADQVITLDDQNTDLNTLINNNGLITD